MKTSNNKPKRCIDPVMKYCQGCEWGCIKYPEWVETYEDTYNCTFETSCMLGLENTKPHWWEVLSVKRHFRKIDKQRRRELKKYEKKNNDHISF